jgi:hypothetical protein
MLFWLAGCTPEPEIALSGVVWDGPGETSPPLGDVAIEILSEDERTLARTRADADGAFSVVLRETGTVFSVLRKDGYATTTFPGVIGAVAEQQVEPHALYAVSLEATAAEEARFAGCPGAGEGAASVGGEVRVFGLEDPITGVAPLVETGKVTLVGEDAPKDEWRACYLADDGVAWDPEAFWTGAAGTFGFFGLPPDVYDLEVRFELSDELYETASYPVYIPDDPVVRAPWYPAWVEFPF